MGEETTLIAERGRAKRGKIDHATGFTSVSYERERGATLIEYILGATM